MAPAGRITSRKKCPACGKVGRYDVAVHPDLGLKFLRCRCGDPAGWVDQPVIRLSWQGRDNTFTCDRKGRRFGSVEEAEAVLGEIRRAIADQTFFPEDYQSATKNLLLWPNWLQANAEREARRLKPATLRKYRAMWRILEPAFGISIKEIRKHHIQDFLDGLDYSAKYKADLAGEVKRLLNVALDREEITRIPRIPVVRVDDKPIRWLSRRQQQQALEQIDPAHWPIFRFLFEHGIRINEATALCWDVIDLDKGEFYVIRTISCRRLTDTTKGGTAYALPLMDEDNELLEDAARKAKEEGIVPAGLVRVFRNPEARNKDQAYTDDYLRGIWRAACEAAGLEAVDLKNATRHSLAMRLRGRVPDAVIARTLGHKTKGQHVAKYARADVSMVREALSSSVQTPYTADVRRKKGSD